MKKYVYILFVFLFVGCDDSVGEVIVKIPEASGITVATQTHSW